MKKSVILILGLIYVGSIVFIAFFGMANSSYRPIIYAEKIECLNEELKVSKTGIKYIDFEYYENCAYFIMWKVLPENASNKAVEFRYTASEEFDIDHTGLILFYAEYEFTLTIRALDGKNVEEAIVIAAKRKI